MVHKFALMGVCINHVFSISEKDIKKVMCKLNLIMPIKDITEIT